MCDLGTSSTDVEINVRLSHLRKAVMCLKDALQSDTERLTFDTSSAAEKIKELQLAINIAGTTVYVIFAELNLNCFWFLEYQKLVHEKLKERYSQFKLNKEMEFLENTDQWLHKLKFHLIDTSTLFNDICLCYSIWDICICILQATNVENNELVSSLWVAYIHRYRSAVIILITTVFNRFAFLVLFLLRPPINRSNSICYYLKQIRWNSCQ